MTAIKETIHSANGYDYNRSVNDISYAAFFANQQTSMSNNIKSKGYAGKDKLGKLQLWPVVIKKPVTGL